MNKKIRSLFTCLLLTLLLLTSCSSVPVDPQNNQTVPDESNTLEETTQIQVEPPPNPFPDEYYVDSIDELCSYFLMHDFTAGGKTGDIDLSHYTEFAAWAQSIAEKGTIYVPCSTDEFVYILDVKEIEITADTYAVPVIDYHLDGVTDCFEIKTSYYTGDMPETAEEMLTFFKTNDFFEWHRKYEKQYTIAAEDLVLGDRTVPAVIFKCTYGGSFFEFVYEDMIVGIMLPGLAGAEEVIAALSFEEIPLSAE